jgi:glycerol-3-phosphate dehydrogenase
VSYSKNGEHHELDCRIIVNAAGPWANRVLARIKPPPETLEVDLVLGTHIIIDGRLEQGMYYLESPRDGRAVFIMPWQDRIMIGTTETLFTGEPEEVRPPESDIDYLLEVYNHYFKTGIGRDQVVDAVAGLRVLPKTSGSLFSRSRDTIIHHDNSADARVYTLYGGKLTAHRATARQLMRQIRTD